MKIADTQTPSTDTKPIDLEASKGKAKRKSSQEKTPSPSKRRKLTAPLLTGPLDPNVHVTDRLQFNLNVEEKKPFKEMSPSESLNMAYELIDRSSICMNYFAGTTKSLLVAELETTQKDLEEAKKENTTLSLHLEETTKAAEEDRIKAANALTEAQNEVTLLKWFVDTLKLDLQKASSQHKELVKERDAAIIERDKLTTENSALGDEVCEERQRGFEQGIAQCHYFFNTPLEHEGFDIMKVYVDDQLVKLSVPEPPEAETDSAATVETVPSGILIAVGEVVNIPFTDQDPKA